MEFFKVGKSVSAKEQRTLLALCYQIICQHALMLLVDTDMYGSE